MGMLLESKYFKKVLAAVTVSESSESEREPPSYSFSYNPIPALIIAVVSLLSPSKIRKSLLTARVDWIGNGSSSSRLRIPSINSFALGYTPSFGLPVPYNNLPLSMVTPSNRLSHAVQTTF